MLRYKYLNNFDAAMNKLEDEYKWLSSMHTYVSLKNEVSSASFRRFEAVVLTLVANKSDKVIVFERADLLFIFNFHPTKSFTDYRVGTDWAGEYVCVFSSDDKEFGGHDRVDKSVHHFTTPMEWNGRKNWMQVYIPCRTALVYKH